MSFRGKSRLSVSGGLKARLGAVVASMAMLATALVGASLAHAVPLNFVNGGSITTTSGNAMHAHGAGVIEDGGYYYMVGENRVEGSSLFNAVSMYRSTDLVNWTHVNDILTRNSHPDLDPANIERPKVIYNAQYDHYVMWAHKENGSDYGDAEVAVAVSDTIDGNYTYQGSFRPLGNMSRDQTVYVDDDGTGYLISAGNENADLNIYRLTDDYLDVEQLVHSFPGDYREAPAVFKRNGVYFLLTSGLTGWDPNQQQYATTTSFPSGNWSGWQNVGRSDGYQSQTTYVLEVSGSATTSYMYMGDRWAGAWGGTPNESGYVWLPLRFPSDTSMALDWYSEITIDAATGEVAGVAAPSSEIVSRATDECLDVDGGSTADAADVTTWSCHGGAHQQWELRDLGGGYVEVVASHSGKCLDVDGDSTANGAAVIQWPCGNGQNQQWELRDAGGGYVELVARHSGKCLDVNTSNGEVQQWSCWGGSNQQWSAD